MATYRPTQPTTTRRAGHGYLALALTAFVLAGCSNNSPVAPGSGNGAPQTQQPQVGGTPDVLEVWYLGFVGQSLTASDPVRCPTPACAVGTPLQTPRTQTTYRYTVSPGTYTVHGTMVGRSAPLTGPAFGVAAELSLDIRFPVPISQTVIYTNRLGAAYDSIFLNGFAFDPRGPNGAGSCGAYFFRAGPDSVVPFVYTFTIASYPLTAPPVTYCA